MDPRKPCRYIVNEEKCPFGRKCKFLHQYEGKPSKQPTSFRSGTSLNKTIDGDSSVSNESKPAKKQPTSSCDEFKGGTGLNKTIDSDGNVCNDDEVLKVIEEKVPADKEHDVSPSANQPPHMPDHPQSGHHSKSKQQKKNPVCRFYLQHGKCKFGEKCRFFHSEGSPLKGDERVAIKRVEKSPFTCVKPREVESTTGNEQRHPPPLTLASFIGGRPHVQRPRRTNQNNASHSLREVGYTLV